MIAAIEWVACAVFVGVLAWALKKGLEPQKGPRVGPYGQIEGDPNDDPYEPPGGPK